MSDIAYDAGPFAHKKIKDRSRKRLYHDETNSRRFLKPWPSFIYSSVTSKRVALSTVVLCTVENHYIVKDNIRF